MFRVDSFAGKNENLSTDGMRLIPLLINLGTLNMQNWICAIVLGLLVSGCATSGPANRTAANLPPDQGMARVTVERSKDFLYLALSARTKVNGISVGALSRGDTASIVVQPGRTTVTVDTATSPGTYSVSFVAQPNREYLLEVAPRSDSFLPGALFGYAGVFVDSAVNEQSGLFQIVGKGENRFDESSQSSAISEQQSSAKNATMSGEVVNPSVQGTTDDRLRKLKQLLEGGLINQQDYERKKTDILRSL